jgi:monoamine oxidase
LDHAKFAKEISSVKKTEDIYFVDWVEKKFGLDYLRHLIENSGYDVLGNGELPLSEAIKILNKHPETSNASLNSEWMQISQGFSHLVGKLQESLKKRNVPFYHSHELIQISKDAQGYELYFYSKGVINKYRANTVILAIPQDALKRVHTNFNIQSLINHISTVPLFKIFSIFPQALWKLINISSNGYFTSATPLRRFYCFPNKNQIVCYCDSKGATYWANLIEEQGVIGLTQEIKRLIASFFKVDLNVIPNIEEVYYRYWPSGVSFWNKETNHLTYQDHFAQNNLFFVSDMFSVQPGWIEGALSNVEKMINHFLCGTKVTGL